MFDNAPDYNEDLVEGQTPVSYNRTYGKLLKWRPPETEHDDIMPFDTAKAWEALLKLPSCQEFMIKSAAQKKLHLVVGVNVTQEFPWKQVPFHILSTHLFDTLPKGLFFHKAFQGYNPEHYVLLGYVPLLTQNMENPPEGDPFILYVIPKDAKTALAIIRNMETYERLIFKRKTVKIPRPWISYGSEIEITGSYEKLDEALEVEIQSNYPMTVPADKTFAPRLSKDVRDGYVELVPTEGMRFDNIVRKRNTIGIQSAPAMKTVEQQVNLTFPTNAWAQYLYEVAENEDGLDPESEDEAAKEKSSKKPLQTAVETEPKKPPVVSEEINFLLSQLEFNQIDMYRNDYIYITNVSMTHFTSLYLEEALSFANISKSYQRYVCGFDWYLSLSGLVVTSYTYTTPATIDSVYKKTDYVQQAVLEPKPILMWSFSDNLNYKLEFESPLEVTYLSFCPHDTNLLFGGGFNGQLIIWDLQDRAERLDYEEILSSAQMRYRNLMEDFLKWTIQIDENLLVPPVTASILDKSQKGAITGIYWLPKHCFMNPLGKTYVDFNQHSRHRYFVTCSMDGTICFWNLDANVGKKAGVSGAKKELPLALAQNESAYKNKLLQPIFMIAYSEPITSIIADTSVLRCKVKESSRRPKDLYNYRIEHVAKDPREIRQTLVLSTMYGRIERIEWQGLYAEADTREVIHTSEHFARVHDGPVICMKKNPFFPWLFVSVGRNVFAVWKEDYEYSPILWRKRNKAYTAVQWCETNPAVLFLTCIDGSMEAWDILSRDDDAVLSEVVGGGIVTCICEHRPTEPEKLLGFGDYNSSLRMIKLPKSLYQSTEDVTVLEEYILREESRKKSIQEWEIQYYEKNKEFIESKRIAEREASKELEKENLMQTNKKTKEVEQTQGKAAISYTERMKRQWEELNLNRLLSILMTRKRVDAERLKKQTALEKERLAFEAAKKETLANILKNIAAEVAVVRAHILPEEVPDLRRNDMIISVVDHVMQLAEPYEDIEAEANEIVEGIEEFVDIEYNEFLTRGEMRRKNLNKSLGGNTEHLFWYNNIRNDNLLHECDWGFDMHADILMIDGNEYEYQHLDDGDDEDEGGDGSIDNMIEELDDISV